MKSPLRLAGLSLGSAEWRLGVTRLPLGVAGRVSDSRIESPGGRNRSRRDGMDTRCARRGLGVAGTGLRPSGLQVRAARSIALKPTSWNTHSIQTWGRGRMGHLRKYAGNRHHRAGAWKRLLGSHPRCRAKWRRRVERSGHHPRGLRRGNAT